MKEERYRTYNHAKTRLRYHIIFSTKYRRKCLTDIGEQVLLSFKHAESISHFRILTMEIDEDHIHFLIEFPPAYSVEQTVRRMKMVSTRYLYDNCLDYLRQFYWKNKRVLWTHGYFCSTIGDMSKETVKHYIENQG
jgi:putative transposase